MKGTLRRRTKNELEDRGEWTSCKNAKLTEAKGCGDWKGKEKFLVDSWVPGRGGVYNVFGFCTVPEWNTRLAVCLAWPWTLLVLILDGWAHVARLLLLRLQPPLPKGLVAAPLLPQLGHG